MYGSIYSIKISSVQYFHTKQPPPLFRILPLINNGGANWSKIVTGWHHLQDVTKMLKLLLSVNDNSKLLPYLYSPNYIFGYTFRIFSSISEWKWYSVISSIKNRLYGHICLQPPPFLVYQAQHPYIYEGEGLISLQGGWQGLLFHGTGIKKYSDTICRGKTLAQCFIWLYRADTEIPSPWK